MGPPLPLTRVIALVGGFALIAAYSLNPFPTSRNRAASKAKASSIQAEPRVNRNSTDSYAPNNPRTAWVGDSLHVMAMRISEGSSPQQFHRHIQRLVWCALLGSIALLAPLSPSSLAPDIGLLEALGAIVVAVAVWDVARDIGRYVRGEATRRRETAQASRIAGACQAADAIQDRVANLLSVTVGYVDFLSEDEHLPRQSREHAQRALDSALAAARVVSAFRQSLRCESEKSVDLAELRALEREAHAAAAESRNAHLLAESPLVREVLNDHQRLAIDLLAAPPREPAEEARIRALLERINDLTQRLEP